MAFLRACEADAAHAVAIRYWKTDAFRRSVKRCIVSAACVTGPVHRVSHRPPSHHESRRRDLKRRPAPRTASCPRNASFASLFGRTVGCLYGWKAPSPAARRHAKSGARWPRWSAARHDSVPLQNRHRLRSVARDPPRRDGRRHPQRLRILGRFRMAGPEVALPGRDRGRRGELNQALGLGTTALLASPAAQPLSRSGRGRDPPRSGGRVRGGNVTPLALSLSKGGFRVHGSRAANRASTSSALAGYSWSVPTSTRHSLTLPRRFAPRAPPSPQMGEG